MRIAVDFTAGVRQHGGVGRYTRSLVRALAEASGEHRLTLLWGGPANVAPPLDWPRTRTRKLPLPERWMTILWQRARLPLPVEAFAGTADVFYSPDFTLPPVARAKTVVTVHDLSYLIFPETHYPPLRRYLERAVPRAVGRADLVLADSIQTKVDLVERMRVDPAKVEVVLSAADRAFRRVEDAGARDAVLRRLGIDRPYILSVGTIQPRKNLPTIFDALSRLDRDVLHVHVGRPGWLYEPIFEALERSGVKDRVRIVGAGDAELAALYSGAVALVFPSLYEGFGLPCLEAMACGCPVIASRSGSLAEVIGQAAIAVDPMDAGAIAAGIVRLMDDDAFRRDLIRLGYAQNSQFRWEDSARQVLALCRGLLPGA